MRVHRSDGTVAEVRGRPVPMDKKETWVMGRRVPRADAIRGEELVRAYTGAIAKAYPNTDDLLAKVRKDGWLNAITGIGDPARDKRHVSNSTLILDILSQMDAEIIWRSDDVAAKAIEKVPEEMTRQGWTLKIEGDDGREVTEAMETWARDLDLIGKAKEALEYSRAYGGAGLFLGADDGQKDLTKP